MAPVFSFADFLEREDCRQFASLFYEKNISAGKTLFDYDEPAETFYFLKEGRLSVQKFTGFQEKMQVVALFGSGAIVSEAALLPNHKHRTRVVAIEDCQLLCLAAKDYLQFKGDASDVVNSFMEFVFSIVSLRLEKTSERLAHIL